MLEPRHSSSRSWPVFLCALPMLALLVIPLIAIATASSPRELLEGMDHPLFLPAMWLSARTTLFSLAAVILLGTPLAWWLARSTGMRLRWVEWMVDLPIILPPAVVGIALLQTFGRGGLLGSTLEAFGWQIPFTTVAVVLAQVVVSAPFYIQSAASAFRRVDDDLMLVARTLGQSPVGAFFRVALPLALPGLISGAALCWARALGEFGATLLFAGNLPGTTQTMPLAIYMALESDVRTALALSLVLAAIALLLLCALRFAPSLWSRWNRSVDSENGKRRTGASV
ncbi:MAG: ABC transporter permease [Planctomycetota bacterium]|nr:ABC transporter permease [Planctomycetota bacterium]